MPTLDLAPAPTPAPRLDMGPDTVSHLFCETCHDDIAICGYKVAGMDWEALDDSDAVTCPLCADLEDEPCPRCGTV